MSSSQQHIREFQYCFVMNDTAFATELYGFVGMTLPDSVDVTFATVYELLLMR
jgi:hypothetical protein